ncbi:glycosyltransferase [Priestia megaterium]|jgi:sterol 3beta-glucosyltransferase|nr:glycosyltransferase [Priestia megaterium]MDC7781104.1 glycosyltransferase [Priestia megaterium]MDR7202564.1 sterol 3beta-glucosyltransferase [Priestia megaterium]MED3827345.1 glycosyltransferase [Priestia megaterium]MED4031886.1 glycosyltransferase [Priestia megaterium]
MMLITMLTTGTRGDTQPFMALGLELKKKGYRVRIAASEAYQDFIESYGFEYAMLRGDVSKIIESGAADDAINADNPLKFFSSLKNEKMMGMMVNIQEDLHKACKGADAIVYHPGAAIGYFAAKEMNIPSILASPFPMTPTKDYPALIFYDRPRFGKIYNKLTHRIFEWGFWKIVSGPLKKYWVQQYGEGPNDFSCPYPKQRTAANPTIISSSPTVFSVSKDWPEHVHSYGNWFMDSDHSYQPEEKLERFLKAGEPPVYIGFGSVGDKKNAGETTALVIKALKLAGKRGIINTGGSGMNQTEEIAEDILFVKDIPHEWLFPKMSAVVHHGGAGTTAEGLRAGVPSIIVPYGNDQFAWGRKIHELGAGAKAIPRKELTAEKLSAAISYTQVNEIRSKAQEIGKQIRAEKGAEKAAQVIINTLETFGNK